jgi:predicted RNase H-like nuclease
MAKIRQVDDFLQKEPQSKKIHEMHPEVGFWALNQRQAMSYSKKTEQGFEQRIELLSKYYSAVGELVDQAMQEYPRKLLARDDIVDAMVCAVVARQADSLQRFPPQPEKDEKGLPMEIVYWEP